MAIETTPTLMDQWQATADDRFNFGKQAYLDAIGDLSKASAAGDIASQFDANVAGGLYNAAQYTASRVPKFDAMQDAYAADAQNYNSAARQKQVGDEAAAGISKQFSSVQDQGNRQLERKGINPFSGRSLAMNGQLGIAKAAATAGAANQARADLERVADERKRTAIGYGQNLTSQAGNLAQSAALVGNSAVSAAQVPLTNRLNYIGGISNIYGNANTNYGDIWKATNLTASDQARLNAASDAQDSADQSALISGIAGIASKYVGTNSGADAVTEFVSGLFKEPSWA